MIFSPPFSVCMYGMIYMKYKMLIFCLLKNSREYAVNMWLSIEFLITTLFFMLMHNMYLLCFTKYIFDLEIA